MTDYSAERRLHTITRTDYRVFEFEYRVEFHSVQQQGERVGRLVNRVNEYLKQRRIDTYTVELEDRVVIVEFATLADARLFALAFADCIRTLGVNFD